MRSWRSHAMKRWSAWFASPALLLAFVAAAGCSGGGGMPDSSRMDVAATDDAPNDGGGSDATGGGSLVGTWSTTSIPGIVPGPGETLRITMTFNADMSLQNSLTDSNPQRAPGCVFV